jgi:ParB family chromosome partitioning protein
VAKSKKPGLGKGLDGLIPSEVIEQQVGSSRQSVSQIPLDKIKANPYQPRTDFDQDSIKQLAKSLDEHGLLQPVVAIRDGESYQLIAGERRVRAARELQWRTIASIIRSEHEQSQLELALIENIQRDDLNPMEVARAYVRLAEEFNIDISEVANRAGKAESTVRNTIRLLNLPEEASQALRKGKLSEGHARQILALDDKHDQEKLLKLIVKNGWSVRQAEGYVRSLKKGEQSKTAAKHATAETPLTKQIAKRLDTNVKIQNTAKGGRLVIEYNSDQQLEKIASYFD